MGSPAPRGTVGGAPAQAPDLSTLSDGVYSILVHGDDRSAVLRVAYAFALANDPAPFWISIRNPGEVVDPPGPLELGWIPEDRQLLLSRADARLRSDPPSGALRSVVTPDAPRGVLDDLVQFVRLPEAIQRALGRFGGESDRRVFVVANTDRIRDLYPQTPDGVARILQAFLHAGALPLLASIASPPAMQAPFDFVFVVRGGAPGTPVEILCEKAPWSTAFTAGRTYPAQAFPTVTAALSGRLPGGGSAASH